MYICPECRSIYHTPLETCERDQEHLVAVQANQDPRTYPLLNQELDGRYHLIGGLGQGGIGTVYLANHIHLDQLSAVKFLDVDSLVRADQEQQDEVLGDFVREAKLAMLLRHDSVVRVMDYGVHDDCPFLVMEYIPGPSLLRKMNSGQRFSIDQCIHIIYSIAEALNAFHERKLVHRDLKPANIILDPRDNGHLTLVDLGLVKDLSNEARSSTHPLALRGTPGYLAPEQVPSWVLSTAGVNVSTEKQPIDARIDIFALGVLAYELLTGHPPYPKGLSPNKVIVHTCTQEPPPIEGSCPAIVDYPGLADLVRSMMAKSPYQRPNNGQEVMAYLDQLLGVQASPPSSLLASTRSPDFNSPDFQRVSFYSQAAPPVTPTPNATPALIHPPRSAHPPPNPPLRGSTHPNHPPPEIQAYEHTLLEDEGGLLSVNSTPTNIIDYSSGSIQPSSMPSYSTHPDGQADFFAEDPTVMGGDEVWPINPHTHIRRPNQKKESSFSPWGIVFLLVAVAITTYSLTSIQDSKKPSDQTQPQVPNPDTRTSSTSSLPNIIDPALIHDDEIEMDDEVNDRDDQKAKTQEVSSFPTPSTYNDTPALNTLQGTELTPKNPLPTPSELHSSDQTDVKTNTSTSSSLKSSASKTKSERNRNTLSRKSTKKSTKSKRKSSLSNRATRTVSKKKTRRSQTKKRAFSSKRSLSMNNVKGFIYQMRVLKKTNPQKAKSQTLNRLRKLDDPASNVALLLQGFLNEF